MDIQDINNIEDDDKYWKEADKYILARFKSEEGQKKLKDFRDAQEELVKSVKSCIHNFSHTREELREYMAKGLMETEDVFCTKGISEADVYNDEAMSLYVSLTFLNGWWDDYGRVSPHEETEDNSKKGEVE